MHKTVTAPVGYKRSTGRVIPAWTHTCPISSSFVSDVLKGVLGITPCLIPHATHVKQKLKRAVLKCASVAVIFDNEENGTGKSVLFVRFFSVRKNI